jgi:tetratricopeptide (TPR) repeat protein
MIKPIILLVLLAVAPGDIGRISKINNLKKSGASAYQAQDFEKASKAFRYLVDSLGVREEPVLLNLANAYFQQRDTSNAAYYYNQLLSSDEQKIRSVAHQQVGIVSMQRQNYHEALEHFKRALKANPGNEEARYNYELLKKRMQEQEQNQQQNQENEDQQENQQENQQQENEEQQKQEQQDQQDQQEQEQQEQEQQEQEKGEAEEQKEEGKDGEPESTEEEGEEMEDQSPTRQERLEELNMTEEKAKMILEAMKNNEIQYIQQNQRKPTQRPDSGKPDW